MEKKFPECNGKVQEALLNTNSALCVQVKEKKVKPKLCGLDVTVCSGCGYVEFYAENLSIFK